MFAVLRSQIFDEWLAKLKDRQARARIINRLDNVRKGILGEYKSLGDDLFELELRYGPGYRLYFTMRSDAIILLLTGGDKSSQRQDIARARAMLEE